MHVPARADQTSRPPAEGVTLRLSSDLRALFRESRGLTAHVGGLDHETGSEQVEIAVAKADKVAPTSVAQTQDGPPSTVIRLRRDGARALVFEGAPIVAAKTRHSLASLGPTLAREPSAQATFEHRIALYAMRDGGVVLQAVLKTDGLTTLRDVHTVWHFSLDGTPDPRQVRHDPARALIMSAGSAPAELNVGAVVEGLRGQFDALAARILRTQAFQSHPQRRTLQ